MTVSEFESWAVKAGPALHRTGFMLTGDWALGQDLVQHAMAATWARWTTVQELDAYARRVMVRTATSWWRRKWRSEIPTVDVAAVPAARVGVDPWPAVDTRHQVRAALQALPPRQRAVIVLRFFDGASESEAAQLLGWPPGTVKSTTSRAIAALRDMNFLDERQAMP